MKITVFTPTYNRGYIIENLYRSLQKQSFHDFEWIVIDDGSTDNTEKLFEEWMQDDNFFKIIYEKVSNGGKHRAINRGVKKANGEMFFIVDSDDYLMDDALERIVNIENTIPIRDKKKFAGVCGNRGYSSGKLNGSTFEGEILDITMLERNKYGISGDKAEAFYLSVLREFPFPEFEGENFITEAVVWNRIASAGYKLRFFNEIIYICDYLSDGLTSKGNKAFEQNPKGWGLYIAQSVQHGQLQGFSKWTTYLNYYNLNKEHMKYLEITRLLNVRPFSFLCRMIGMLLFYKIYQ